jgi:hypothetical protein
LKNVRQYLTLLSLVYALLGAASVLCLIRFTLRLLAADELNPVGRKLVQAGAILTGPFEKLFHLEPVGQLPGSTFEPSALAGGLGFLVIALLISLAVGSWHGLKGRKVSRN